MGETNTENLIQIDGRMGEGGGQVLRTSLALSMLTGKPFRIDNIRGNRKKPGLMRQHLTCVKAAERISGAHTLGASLNSSRLDFYPGPINPGRYDFAIGTAGSTVLVLQSILPALMLADAPSEITIEGGTHNDKAPPFEYLSEVFLPILERMGPRVTATLERYGFYPVGGGRIHIEIDPVKKLSPLSLKDKGEIGKRSVRALGSQIPGHVTQRELKKARNMLNDRDLIEKDIKCNSVGPGNAVLLRCDCEHVTEIFSAVGSPKISAEKVANIAAKAYRQWIVSDAPASEHLADQLAIPCALACTKKWGNNPLKPSVYRAASLDQHAHTQYDLLPMFIDVDFNVEEGFDERRQAKYQEVTARSSMNAIKS